MPLESQVVNIPFSGGINTKEDPKQVSAGELLTLENAVFTNPKELRKRDGNTALGSSILAGSYSLTFPAFSSAPTAGSFLASYRDQLLMGDGFNLYGHSSADNKWAYKGRCESARLTTQQVWQDKYNNISSDSAINTTSGLTLYAWERWNNDILIGSYLGVGYSIVDTATGQVLYNATLGSTTQRPRCIAISGFLYLLYYDSTGTALKAVSVTSSSVSAPTTLISNIDTTLPNYDCLVVGSNIYVGYNGATNTVKVASFSSALASVASVSKAEVASNGIGIFSDTSNNIWVAYNNASATKAFIMNSALGTTVLAPTVVDSGGTATAVRNVTGIYDGTQGIIFYDRPGLPAIGQATQSAVTTNYVQPAVGATVSTVVTTTAGPGATLDQVQGQIVYIAGGGYYLTGTTVDPVDMLNLGYAGNAAPGATITQPAQIYQVNNYDTALITRNTLTVAGSVGTPANFIRSCALASRAFLYNGFAHVYATHDSKTQPSYFLCALYNVDANGVLIAHVPVKVFEGAGGGIPNKSVLSSVNVASTNNYQCALPRRVFTVLRTTSNLQSTFFLNGISSATVNFAPTQVSRKEIGNNTHVASGTLMMYDGANTVEHGFHLFPDWITVASAGVASGAQAAGTYGYKAVYQWIDAQGQIHQSAPSLNVSFKLGANEGATITVPTLRVTQKNTATVTLYRTLADTSGVYYRVDSSLASFPVSNSLTADTVTFTDILNDASLTGNAQLYTDGQIENIAAPSPLSLATFKNRLLIVSADNPNTEWYSQQVVPGSPVETTDTFVQNTDQSSGSIVGSVQMDDKWIQMKGENIYYIVGTGPTPSGTNNDLTDSTLIATDVGLIDLASIVVFPNGVIFKSAKGVYLLDRSLQVSYIGAKVEAYNAYNVLSAKLVATKNQVRFILSSGQAIVYDYFVNTWSVFTNFGFVDSEINNDLYYSLKSNGTVLVETPGVYSDNGSFISMKLVSAWLGLSGLQGFQRVWKMLILGTYESAHQLSVAFAYDFDSTVAQTVTITPATNIPYQWQIGPARQKCDSMQITIQDVYTSVIGESYRLSAMSFEAGVKKGANRVGSTQRVT